VAADGDGLVRVEPEWIFTEVLRAALALAREIERRVQGDVQVVEGGASRWTGEPRRVQPSKAKSEAES